MNINEASEYTKLSKKTLRFYESKGLFITERKEIYNCFLKKFYESKKFLPGFFDRWK